MTEEKQVEKVLVYVTRKNKGQVEVLVFRHQDFPEAGVQVPAGTVESGEDLAFAALREVREETGLALVGDDCKYLGRFKYFRKDRSEIHWRNVFQFQFLDYVKDEWLHTVGGHGEDQQMVFRCYWMPVEKAKIELAVDQGGYFTDSTGLKN